MVGGIQNLMSKEVMKIVLEVSSVMSCIRTDRMYSQIAVKVIDCIWWPVDIPHPKSWSGPKVARRLGRAGWLSRCSARMLGC